MVVMAILLSCRLQSLGGTNWVVSTLNGQLPLPGSALTLQLGEDGAATGSDGCNRFTTTFTASRSTISFEPAATTMMACPEAVPTQANDYMTAAPPPPSPLPGGHLVLLNGTTVLATFIAASQQLAGTQWQVIAYNNGREAVVSLLLGTDITVEFEEDGQVSGNAGCNDFFGPFETGDGTIDDRRPRRHAARCARPPAGVMQQEAEFLAALESAATYTVEGNFLEMRDADDAIAVHMTRVLEVVVPTPEPTPGIPTGRSTAPNGLNVRSGPGTNFPVLATVRYGTEGEIIGRSADGRWWVVRMPSAPGGSGWVSADFVAVSNAADVPIIASPPPPVIVVPTPAPTPTRVPAPTATPGPQMSLRANPTTINQGQCSTLEWNVQNVQAVWVYPQGQPYHQFPRRPGQRTRSARPTRPSMRCASCSATARRHFQPVTVTVRPAAVQNPLDGTSWEVTGYYIGNAVASPLSGSTLTFRFSGNQISGNSGCNTFTGTYSVSGNNIWISDLSSGMMLCDTPPGVMQQETDFLAALRARRLPSSSTATGSRCAAAMARRPSSPTACSNGHASVQRQGAQSLRWLCALRG